MKTFLSESITRILKENKDLSKITVILPTQRLCSIFISLLIKEINSPQFSPNVYSIKDFIAKLSNLSKASKTQEYLYLYKIYLEVFKNDLQHDFENFIKWAPTLISDFNKIDNNIIDSKLIFKDLYEFQKMENLFENNSDGNDLSFWNLIHKLYQEFSKILIAKRKGTTGILHREAVKNFKKHIKSENHFYYMIGFNALNNSEKLIFQTLLNTKKGIVLWDLDKYFFDKDSHSTAKFIKEYQREWNYYKKKPFFFHSNNYIQNKRIKVISTNTDYEQALKVSEITRNLSDNTLIVLGNEGILSPLLSNLNIKDKKWNVTMGYKLTQLPITRFFLTYFNLHSSLQNNNFKTTYLSQIINNTFSKKFIFNDEIDKIENLNKIIFSNFDEISYEKIKRLFKTEILLKVFCPKEDMLLCLQDSISILKYITKNKNLDKFNISVSEILLDTFEEMMIDSNVNHFKIPKDAWYYIINELLKTKKLDFKGDKMNGIQIMGILQTRGLDFENVIITHVNEGTFPQSKRDDSFLPFSIRKAYGIPTFLEKDAINSYHFFRILQRAKNIFLLNNGSTGVGLLTGEKSRYIRQISFSKIPSHNFQEVILNQNIKNTVINDPSIDKSTEIIKKLKYISKNGFSATSLSTYLNNPIDFYYKYILEIPDYTPETNTLNNLERGILIHKVVEELYTPYLKKDMKISYYDEILKKIKIMLINYFNKFYGEKYDLTGENFLIISAYERAITLFVNKEKKLVNDNNRIIILDIEKEFKVNLENEVFLKGKIDRIDKFNDRVRILDYKTGYMDPKYLIFKPNFEHFKGDYKLNNQFQLLLYLLALKIEGQKAENFQAGVISLKSPFKNIIPLKNKSFSKSKSDSLLDPYSFDKFHEFLKSVIGEIFDKKKSFVSL